LKIRRNGIGKRKEKKNKKRQQNIDHRKIEREKMRKNGDKGDMGKGKCSPQRSSFESGKRKKGVAQKKISP